jgi:hypothetical protein
METFRLIKVARNNSYDLSVDTSANCAVLTLLGVWDKTCQLEYYLEDISLALQKLSLGFTLLLDLTHYKGSTSDFMQLHIDAQKLAINSGLSKTAVILPDNPMIKVAVEYIIHASGMNASYFNNRLFAEKWLTV